MQDIDAKEQLIQFAANLKYRSFSIWQVLTAIQICVIFSLIGTIGYKAYTNNKTNTAIADGTVAGLATEKYNIPNEVNITIEEISKSFNPIDFGFEFKEIRDRDGRNEFVQKIRDFIKKEEVNTTVYDKYLEFDETKFSYWLKANFGTLEKEIPQKPQLIFFDDSKEISECIPGYSTRKIPVQTILNDLKSFKQLPEDLYFVVDVGVLAEDELTINNICNQINEFKHNLKKVKIKTSDILSDDKKTTKEVYKTYDFISENDIDKIFSFHLIKEQLVAKITKKDLLRQSIEQVKRIFDQNPQTRQIRVADKLIIIGEEKEIIVINTEESIRVAENLLVRGEPMENFPLIIEKNDGIYNSNNVIKYPKKIASAVVKIPTLYQEDAIKMTKLLDMYSNFTIQPNQTYSFKNHVAWSKLSPLLSNEMPFKLNTSEEQIEYYKSLEPISSLFFRLALDSGLPFIERYQNVLNKDINHFGFPVSEMPLVNITGTSNKLSADGTIKNRDLDLKFANPSDQAIFITTQYEFIDNNEVMLKAEMYTTQQFNTVNVEIKDFQKDVFDINGQFTGYFVVFNRFVNETKETYSIYYFDDQQPKLTSTPAGSPTAGN